MDHRAPLRTFHENPFELGVVPGGRGPELAAEGAGAGFEVEDFFHPIRRHYSSGEFEVLAGAGGFVFYALKCYPERG